MRELVSSRGPINERSDAFGAEAMSLMGVIAALQQTSVAPAVKRAADGLASGFIAPAAGGRGDLADRQTSVVGRVESAVAAQSAALSAAADKISHEQQVEPDRFQPLSTAEAVIRYAGDFLPSWAGCHLDRPDAGGAGADLLRSSGRVFAEKVSPKPARPPCPRPTFIAALRLAREVENARCR